MSEVSVEQINGKLMTVIRKPFDAEWVRKQLSVGMPSLCYIEGKLFVIVLDDYDDTYEALHYRSRYGFYNDGHTVDIHKDHIDSLAIILPPLPRHPTADDAWLLYEYAAKGLYAVLRDKAQYAGKFVGFAQGMWCVSPTPEQAFTMGLDAKTTHCTDEQGNRVEIAISDSN